MQSVATPASRSQFDPPPAIPERPRTLHLPQLDEATLGALIAHFTLETLIAADLLGVDPFDQPAVEDGKIKARRYLAEIQPQA